MAEVVDCAGERSGEDEGGGDDGHGRDVAGLSVVCALPSHYGLSVMGLRRVQ